MVTYYILNQIICKGIDSLKNISSKEIIRFKPGGGKLPSNFSKLVNKLLDSLCGYKILFSIGI